MIQNKSNYNKTKKLATNLKMKKIYIYIYINNFLHYAEKWSNIHKKSGLIHIVRF